MCPGRGTVPYARGRSVKTDFLYVCAGIVVGSEIHQGRLPGILTANIGIPSEFNGTGAAVPA
ncbi:hypothetical protein BCAR13_90086 [Paraburkholderia caribensis]|nr:hypothetical protein BCAR13_90086 [Paraburkholderia caribensis]